MFNNYLYILLFIIIALLFAVSFLSIGFIVSRVINSHYRAKAKQEAYECGFEAFADARGQFKVQYYLIAVLFIIFDIEMVLLLPWALMLKDISWPGFITMNIFLIMLVLGLIYEWKKGALVWE